MVIVRRHARIPLLIATILVLAVVHVGFSLDATVAILMAIGFVSWLSYRYIQFRAFVDAGIRNKIEQSRQAGIILTPKEIKHYRKLLKKMLSPAILPWVPYKKPQSKVSPKRIDAAVARPRPALKPVAVEPYLSIVKRHKKPTVHLALKSDISESAPTAVRVGGRPRLPSGIAWPRISKNMLGTEDVAMHFVAQIDCAELLKGHRSIMPLPEIGSLLIFADLCDLQHHGQPEHCRVIYTPKKPDDLPYADLPDNLPNTFLQNRYLYEKSEQFGFTDHPQLLPETELCGLPSLTYPHREHLHMKLGALVGTDWEDHEDASFNMTMEAVKATRSAAGIDDSERARHKMPWHQMGGYVHPIQTPHPNGNEAVLLALEHDEALGFMFACGHLIFVIDEGDLQNCNFRSVKAYFYCD